MAGDFGSLRNLVLDVNFECHGVDAIVTPRGGVAAPARAVWLSPITGEVPIGAIFQMADRKRVICFRRAEVAPLPLESQIEAPDRLGGSVGYWRVEGTWGREADHLQYVVVPDPDPPPAS